MISQISKLHQIYLEVTTAWGGVYGATQQVQKDVSAGVLKIEDLADAALLLKRTVQKLEDARAECNKALSKVEQVACLLAVHKGHGGPIRGELCTASTKTGQEPPSIKRADNPELYDQVMTELGFSKEACENEIARIHYPNVAEYLSKLMAEGRPLPKALAGMQLRPTFKLVCRCNSGVDLDLLTSPSGENHGNESSNDPETGSDIPF